MENKFDYQSVPYGFAHCFHSQCIHKEECLHQLAAANCTSQYPTLSIINPNRIPADTTDCPYFRKSQKYRVAWGIRHLLDNVPHKCAAPMRHQLVGYFGKTTYYRFYRQEQGLFPKAHINRKTFCATFSNHFVSFLELLTQNELRKFIRFSGLSKHLSKAIKKHLKSYILPIFV